MAILPNPTPFLLRLVGGWPSIAAQVDTIARDRAWPTYSEAPTRYRFSGWGTVGFPPALACNVYYFPVDGPMVDMGRVVG
ncbi:hypothetical protein [Leptolyngbya sp. KIOST-1]|uniref:hypothetical protein n=1 Tax=Leptolyngbya sp. KIOST-1 TaxID=1229172 RepID=UPI00055ABDF0|nr:hypothetical protein [Leptolyngbya sp. KIOST-1]